jgi:hypothetical protein
MTFCVFYEGKKVHFLLSLRVKRESERGVERRERGESEKWIMMNYFFSFFVLVGDAHIILNGWTMDDDGVFSFQVVRNHTYSVGTRM